MMNDSERIKKTVLWLVNNGYAKSQVDLAEQLGYNTSSFSQIVSGKKRISYKFAKKLAGVSEKVNINYLLGNDTNMLIKDVEKEREDALEHIKQSIDGLSEHFRKMGDVLEQKDDYIERMVAASFKRNEENMKRVDELIKIINSQNQKMQQRADKLIDILGNNKK